MNTTYIVVVIVVLAILFLLQREQYDSNIPNSYQGAQPWFLSQAAVKEWTIPAKKLCRDRVAAECANVPMVDRIGCIQKAMLECEQFNSKVISQSCVNNLTTSFCKDHCKDVKSTKCNACVYYAQSQGVCLQPDLSF